MFGPMLSLDIGIRVASVGRLPKLPKIGKKSKSLSYLTRDRIINPYVVA